LSGLRVPWPSPLQTKYSKALWWRTSFSTNPSLWRGLTR
jgi:hypothetical protein